MDIISLFRVYSLKSLPLLSILAFPKNLSAIPPKGTSAAKIGGRHNEAGIWYCYFSSSVSVRAVGNECIGDAYYELRLSV